MGIQLSPLISYSLARLPPSGASARSALTQLEIVVTVHDPTREPGKAGTAGAISCACSRVRFRFDHLVGTQQNCGQPVRRGRSRPGRDASATARWLLASGT